MPSHIELAVATGTRDAEMRVKSLAAFADEDNSKVITPALHTERIQAPSDTLMPLEPSQALSNRSGRAHPLSGSSIHPRGTDAEYDGDMRSLSSARTAGGRGAASAAGSGLSGIRLRVHRRTLLVGGAALLIALVLFLSSGSDHAADDGQRTYSAPARKRPSKQGKNSRLSSSGSSGSSGGAGGKYATGKSTPAPSYGDSLEIDSHGLVTWVSGTTDEHPIKRLIARGAKVAQEIEGRRQEVQSLEDAVDDYERAFKMRPPIGFDSWYQFNHRHSPPSTSAASLLSWAHKSLLTYMSFPVESLRERIDNVRPQTSVFTFTFVPDGEGDEGTACDVGEEWEPKDWHTRGKGRVRVRGGGAWSWRCNNTLKLVLPMLNHFPKEMFQLKPPLELPFALDDGPRTAVHSTYRDRSESLAMAGKVWPKSQLHKAEQSMRWTYGWSWACPEGTPLKTSHSDMILNDLPSAQSHFDASATSSSAVSKTFVGDFYQSVDYCSNLDMMPLHHILFTEKHRQMGAPTPVVAACRSLWNADVLGVPLDGVWETVDYIPWEEKSIDKVLWAQRGSATGAFHNKDTPWRSGQRERLHFFAQNKSDSFVPLLLNDHNGAATVREWSIRELNEKWLDVGLSGSPNQCSKEDGSCQEMEDEIDFLGRVGKEEQPKFKYAIDVDGNGWSSRYRRLLAGNNVVLKSTVYPEWFNDQLVPWYHYVPLKLDYSDIYDILAFFNGAPDGSTPGNDDLARQIAANALKFTQEHWRHEDMQSYTFLLILEFWRVMSKDKDRASL